MCLKTNLVIALAAEARAIIDFYKLKRDTSHTAFEVYSNPQQMTLIISGIGHDNVIAATNYLAGIQNSLPSKTLWLNIGVAGHTKAAIGQTFRVNKIQYLTNVCGYNEAANSESSSAIKLNSYFPANTLKNRFFTSEKLVSFNQANQDYHQFKESLLMDMEGYGFFKSAKRYASVENIQLIKIVSDNGHQKSAIFDTKMRHQFVVNLITNEMSHIDQYLAALKISLISALGFENNNFAKDEAKQQLEHYQSRVESDFHFSSSQKIKLSVLLSNYMNRFGYICKDDLQQDDKDPFAAEQAYRLLNQILVSSKTSREFLQNIENYLKNASWKL